MIPPVPTHADEYVIAQLDVGPAAVIGLIKGSTLYRKLSGSPPTVLP
jgi:hypothetical protein